MDKKKHIKVFKDIVEKLCSPYDYDKYHSLVKNLSAEAKENIKKILSTANSEDGNAQSICNKLNNNAEPVSYEDLLADLQTIEGLIKYRGEVEAQRTSDIKKALKRDAASEVVLPGKLLGSVIGELWEAFAESLLSGEFLYYADYSEVLNGIIQKINETYKQRASEEIVYFHPVLLKIKALCEELSYMCQLTRVQIKGSGSVESIIHAQEVQLIGRPYVGGLDSEEVRYANVFYELGRMLITVTSVDLRGLIDTSILSTLFSLERYAEILQDDNDEACSIDFPRSESSISLFRRIRAKVSLLLYQSFYKPQIQDTNRLICYEKSAQQPYIRAKNAIVFLGGLRYYIIGGANSNNLLHNRLGAHKELIFASGGQEGADVADYNQYVQGQHKDGDGLFTDEEIKKKLRNHLECAFKMKSEEFQGYSLGVLLSFMRVLERLKGAEKSKVSSANFARVMGELLRVFAEQIEECQYFVSGAYKRGCRFDESFFSLSGGLEGDTRPIFISSYGCRMINISSLESKVYPHYLRIYRNWSSLAHSEALEDARGLKDEFNKLNGTLEKTQQEVEKSVQEVDSVRQQIDKTKRQVDGSVQQVDKTKKDVISSISIFVAIITFISGGITILRELRDLSDYLILVGTLYVFVVSIVGVLCYQVFESEGKKVTFSRLVIGVSFSLALLSILGGFCLKYFSGRENSTVNRVGSEIDSAVVKKDTVSWGSGEG